VCVCIREWISRLTKTLRTCVPVEEVTEGIVLDRKRQEKLVCVSRTALAVNVLRIDMDANGKFVLYRLPGMIRMICACTYALWIRERGRRVGERNVFTVYARSSARDKERPENANRFRFTVRERTIDFYYRSPPLPRPPPSR